MKRAAIATLIMACTLNACDRRAEPQPVPAVAEKPGPGAAPPAFCVVALETELVGRNHPLGLDQTDLAQAVATELRQRAHVAGVVAQGEGDAQAGCAAAATRDDTVGIHLRFEYALVVEGRAVPAAALRRSAEARFAVQAHAERAGPAGRPEIGLGNVSGAFPVPKARQRHLGPFLAVRLVQAAITASDDALGQLAVRHVDDETILTLLDAPAPWRRMAALRELGERGMRAGLKPALRAAGSSRRDIAMVAVATLSRLGGEAATDRLAELLDTAPLEVATACLQALADIGTPKAHTALTQAADDHPVPWIRHRARALLHR